VKAFISYLLAIAIVLTAIPVRADASGLAHFRMSLAPQSVFVKAQGEGAQGAEVQGEGLASAVLKTFQALVYFAAYPILAVFLPKYVVSDSTLKKATLFIASSAVTVFLTAYLLIATAVPISLYHMARGYRPLGAVDNGYRPASRVLSAGERNEMFAEIREPLQKGVRWSELRYSPATGLCDSYEDEGGKNVPVDLKRAGHTFDQALAGLKMDALGAHENAAAILSGLQKVQLSDGAWFTTYDVMNGAPIFHEKHIGPVAFVVIMHNFHVYATGGPQRGDLRFVSMARAAAEWILTHRRPDGSFRTARSGMPDVASVEENEDCYSALLYLSVITGEPRYRAAADECRKFIESHWDDAKGYFHQGAAGPVADRRIAYDPSIWGRLILGPRGPRGENYDRGVEFIKRQLLVSDDTGIRYTADMEQYGNVFWIDPTIWYAIARLDQGESEEARAFMKNVFRFQTVTGGLPLNEWKGRGAAGKDAHPDHVWPLYPYAGIHPVAAAVFYAKRLQDPSFNIFHPKIGCGAPLDGITVKERYETKFALPPAPVVPVTPLPVLPLQPAFSGKITFLMTDYPKIWKSQQGIVRSAVAPGEAADGGLRLDVELGSEPEAAIAIYQEVIPGRSIRKVDIALKGGVAPGQRLIARLSDAQGRFLAEKVIDLKDVKEGGFTPLQIDFGKTVSAEQFVIALEGRGRKGASQLAILGIGGEEIPAVSGTQAPKKTKKPAGGRMYSFTLGTFIFEWLQEAASNGWTGIALMFVPAMIFIAYSYWTKGFVHAVFWDTFEFFKDGILSALFVTEYGDLRQYFKSLDNYLINTEVIDASL